MAGALIFKKLIIAWWKMKIISHKNEWNIYVQLTIKRNKKQKSAIFSIRLISNDKAIITK